MKHNCSTMRSIYVRDIMIHERRYTAADAQPFHHSNALSMHSRRLILNPQLPHKSHIKQMEQMEQMDLKDSYIEMAQPWRSGLLFLVIFFFISQRFVHNDLCRSNLISSNCEIYYCVCNAESLLSAGSGIHCHTRGVHGLVHGHGGPESRGETDKTSITMAGRLHDIGFSGKLHWEESKKASELTSQCFVYPLMILIVVSESQENRLFSGWMFLIMAGATNLGGGLHIENITPDTLALLLKVGLSTRLIWDFVRTNIRF